jgi:membrane protein implicated in regulation of membrane protease activity
VTWWLWVLVGFGLLACELLTPGGFFFVFFGASAIVVGVLARVVEDLPAWLQWLLFTVVSLAFMVPLRGRLVRWMAGHDRGAEIDSLVGQLASVLDDLAPDPVGKVELRGTTWNARNAAGRALRRGERARVARVDGLTLWLEAE